METLSKNSKGGAEDKICFVSVDVEDGTERMEEILDIFKKYSISATLFVTGEVLQARSELVQEWSRNHEIASHSFTHRFWSGLGQEERRKELKDFISLYQDIFGQKPKGFRAPSHVIDAQGLALLKESGFLYDSSILPHYPPFKKYRGYQGKKPRQIHFIIDGLLEIPVAGHFWGVPLAGAWVTKLPGWFYRILFFFYQPRFIALSWHSWDRLKNLERIIKLLKSQGYHFLNGEQICTLFIPK